MRWVWLRRRANDSLQPVLRLLDESPGGFVVAEEEEIRTSVAMSLS
jgi:hypothetical protein